MMSLDTYNVGVIVGKERQGGGYNPNKKWIITISYGECKVRPTQTSGERVARKERQSIIWSFHDFCLFKKRLPTALVKHKSHTISTSLMEWGKNTLTHEDNIVF